MKREERVKIYRSKERVKVEVSEMKEEGDAAEREMKRQVKISK